MYRHHIRPRQGRGRRGFTLTELLIVMAILVLLVSLVGPRLLGSKKKADINSAKTQIGMLQAALERYALDMNRFPNPEEGLEALVEDPTQAVSEDGAGSEGSPWDGPYLKQSAIPKDPWSKSYSYEYPPVRGKEDLPEIWSFGPDGQEETEDDIVSWTSSDRSGDPVGDDSTTASLD